MKNKFFSLTFALLFSTGALNAMDKTKLLGDIEKYQDGKSKKVTVNQLIKALKNNFKNNEDTQIKQLLNRIPSQNNAQDIIKKFREWINLNNKAFNKKYPCYYPYLINAYIYAAGISYIILGIYNSASSGDKILTGVCFGGGASGIFGGGLITHLLSSMRNQINLIKQNPNKIKEIMIKLRQIELIYKK